VIGAHGGGSMLTAQALAPRSTHWPFAHSTERENPPVFSPMQ
jgi:hypothetical protein